MTENERDYSRVSRRVFSINTPYHIQVGYPNLNGSPMNATLQPQFMQVVAN